jgi:cytochrome c peroxidase
MRTVKGYGGRFIRSQYSIGAVSILLSFTLVHAQTTTDEMSSSKEVDKARKTVINVQILDQMTKLPGDLGPLPAVSFPMNNPQTQPKVELGKMLFFDTRLSGDNKSSCATCHDPARGFADGKARAIGFGGQELGRHSPTVLNVAYNEPQFWDGRAAGLEDQAEKPIEAAVEMNLPRTELARRLNNIPGYKTRFLDVFGGEANLQKVAKAIAAFERTLITPDSRFDQYMRGDKQALTEQEKRGLVLFVSKAACTQCHNGYNLTDNQFHVLGVPQQGPNALDVGRYEVTKDEMDKGAFKTPTLRNIALTGPYMHDGAFETLEQVVDFYNQGGGAVSNRSPKIMKLRLTQKEKEDLVAFLKTLTGKMPAVEPPILPH